MRSKPAIGAASARYTDACRCTAKGGVPSRRDQSPGTIWVGWGLLKATKPRVHIRVASDCGSATGTAGMDQSEQKPHLLTGRMRVGI